MPAVSPGAAGPPRRAKQRLSLSSFYAPSLESCNRSNKHPFSRRSTRGMATLRFQIKLQPSVGSNIRAVVKPWYKTPGGWVSHSAALSQPAAQPGGGTNSASVDSRHATCVASSVTSSVDRWPTSLVPGEAAASVDEEPAAACLDSLPDDALLQIIASCVETWSAGPLAARWGTGGPDLHAVSGLGCLCREVLQQLYRLRPLVSVQVRNLRRVILPQHKTLTTRRQDSQGPWHLVFLYMGELVPAVLEQARRGHVRSVDAHLTALTPRVARRVVPELLGAGCSLLDLFLEGVSLAGSWATMFGKEVVCSAVLRELQLNGCWLTGPLPELQLPALQVLGMSCNHLSGGLEPLRGCTALRELNLARNQIQGGLEPLSGCTALKWIDLTRNQLTGGLEVLAAPRDP